VTTDHTLELRLAGDWSTTPPVRVDGRPGTVATDIGSLIVYLTPGRHEILVGAGA
jgi:hypothetical protein